ncbi:MAG TPA: MarR family transcriptional regulator [Spirochaetota bacterium]|nr:MarR family transcriptional regulator [Spirochaetota bacterium]HPI87867.1 MarR family transcriptional regulator [Spirochaetota bacterium]HPR47401.1 MarR family transcriptional regulator [Spirochaetota bacterium]
MAENDEYLKLDNQLCFVLYAGSRAITRLYKPLLDRLNLTYPQYLVMLVLWENDSQSVTGIGKRLQLDSGTLTPLLKRLESQGLILRQRLESDERKVIVALTDKGKKLKNKAAAIPRELLCRSGLSEKEFRLIKDTISALIVRMDQGPAECGDK